MKKIVLALASPRRRELIEKYNLKTEIVKSSIEEKIVEGELPEQVAMSLAYEKAYDVSKAFQDEEIIIGADTIVVFQNEILGKPKDYKDAFYMLKNLSSRTHYVITGIAIVKANTNVKVVDYEKTSVTFKSLTDDKIYRYLSTDEYKDKAGAYGIQGYGEILVEKIEGCYSNVVGLPISKLEMLLENYFGISLL